eukprot:CAMPEP_0198259916 /NCGR_PEP_ID=MMETSP1447-20131203/8993_1 /TAXON_ID=420782 /ORGANISM="Chaetoceros dichaeta, Strain CCMP1751" /LENGTH=371 /DNA_ID=CAMNT_0043947437 /DNA_START=272 /DNA_END=1387 /DNA_ORIENTATION=-
MAIAIMRAVTHNVVRNITCMRLFTDIRVPTWLPSLPNESVRVVHQKAASVTSNDGCPVTGEWSYPKDLPDPRTTPPRRSILYIHGGAFALCNPRTHRGITMRLVEASSNRSNGSDEDGVAVFSLDYRRPPQHPHPAPIEDCLVAYTWLLRYMGDGAEDRIVLAGDSAGGAMVVLMMTEMKRDAGLPLPAGAIMLSPWVDLEDTSLPSWDENKDLDYLLPDLTDFCARAFVGNDGPSLYTASATNQDLTGLPPLLIMVGEKEVFRDQTVVFSDKAKAAGISVELTVEPGMVHVFPTFADILPTSFTTKWYGQMGVFVNNASISQQCQTYPIREASLSPTGDHKMFTELRSDDCSRSISPSSSLGEALLPKGP